MRASDTEHLCPGCFTDKGTANPCPQCGYDEHAARGPLVLPHRSRLNRQFLIGRVLGKPGGFGITYLAWDEQLQTRVAIKEYLPRDLAGRDGDSSSVAAHSGEDAELFRYGLDQFLREARTLAQLDHPNIVRVRQFFEANGTAYLVMDYYEGLSLAEYLDQQGGKLPEQAAVQLMLPILDGLRAVHAKGFLHRDVKPQNIYLAKTDVGGTRPILLDFGAARQAMGERSRSLSVVVSAGYAPFEQYQRKGEQGPWTDIYAAAAVLYRAVTGIEPPEAIERIQDDNLRPAATFGIDQALSDALKDALALTPSERLATVEVFQAHLLGTAQLQTAPSVPVQQPTTESSASRSHGSRLVLRIGLAMFVLLGVVSGAALLLINPKSFSDIVPIIAPRLSNDAALAEREAQGQQAGLARESAAEEARLSESQSASAAQEASLQHQRGQRAAEQAELLATCRDYMDSQRFTYPEDANALLCYREVMKTDPKNAEAKHAFARMIAFYRDSAEQAFALGKRERVQDRIERMRKIYPDSPEAEHLEKRLAEQPQRAPFEPELASILGGCFQMGSPGSEEGRYDYEHQHRVCVGGFKIGKYEVTQAEWKSVMGDNPSYFTACNGCPVEQVNWSDVNDYIEKLNRITSKRYRLPTEAEWEYAARAGSTTSYPWGNDIGQNNANCYGCESPWGPEDNAPVGSFSPNVWGLYDTVGNVAEWTCSAWSEDYDGSEKGCANKSYAGLVVIRGGSADGFPRWVRSAWRVGQDQDIRSNSIGFRLVQDPN